MAFEAEFEGREWVERHWKKFSRDGGGEYEVVTRKESTKVRVDRRKENGEIIVSSIAQR